MHSNVRYSVAIFLAREPLRVCLKTLSCALNASSGLKGAVSIDLLINGNNALASEVVSAFASGSLINAVDSRTEVRVWSLAIGDKANAWNAYLHRIWANEQMAFFIDGYVRLRPDALSSLADNTAGSVISLGGTGVPSVGPSASRIRKQMIESGGFHGNLCCIKGATIHEMISREIRIPIGMYRVDSFVGSVLSFGMNPSVHAWDSERIAVDEKASWDTDAKRWWRWSDLMSTRSRLWRQARGRMENAAVRYFFVFKKLMPEALPSNALDLIEAWALDDPSGFRSFIYRDPLAWCAFKQYRRDWKIDLSRRDDVELLSSVSLSAH